MTQTITLNDGKQIPAVGFGNMHGWENGYSLKAEEVPALALKYGFRHLDTAQVGNTATAYIDYR
jgi:diketogulonate reductase-like aldo/keto reductase